MQRKAEVLNHKASFLRREDGTVCIALESDAHIAELQRVMPSGMKAVGGMRVVMVRGLPRVADCLVVFCGVVLPREVQIVRELKSHLLTYSCELAGSSKRRTPDPHASNNITTSTNARPGKNASHHMPADR